MPRNRTVLPGNRIIFLCRRIYLFYAGVNEKFSERNENFIKTQGVGVWWVQLLKGRLNPPRSERSFAGFEIFRSRNSIVFIPRAN